MSLENNDAFVIEAQTIPISAMSDKEIAEKIDELLEEKSDLLKENSILNFSSKLYGIVALVLLILLFGYMFWFGIAMSLDMRYMTNFGENQPNEVLVTDLYPASEYLIRITDENDQDHNIFVDRHTFSQMSEGDSYTVNCDSAVEYVFSCSLVSREE